MLIEDIEKALAVIEEAAKDMESFPAPYGMIAGIVAGSVKFLDQMLHHAWKSQGLSE